MYGPQKDRALSTSKKKSKMVEQVINLTPPKMDPKYT
jgi:hypothetical protein